MAMGLPCVVTNVSGTSEFITGDNSFPVRARRRVAPL